MFVFNGAGLEYVLMAGVNNGKHYTYICADSSVVLVLLYSELDKLKSCTLQTSSLSTARRVKASSALTGIAVLHRTVLGARG